MPHSNVTARLTLRTDKAFLYYFFRDAIAAMEELQDSEDTYALEISVNDTEHKITVRNITTTSIVVMKVFHQESL